MESPIKRLFRRWLAISFAIGLVLGVTAALNVDTIVPDADDPVVVFAGQHPVAGIAAAMLFGSILFLLTWHMHWINIEQKNVFGDYFTLSTYALNAGLSLGVAGLFAMQSIAFGRCDLWILDVGLVAGIFGFAGLFFDSRRIAIPCTRFK